jgi:hypothetical protein
MGVTVAVAVGVALAIGAGPVTTGHDPGRAGRDLGFDCCRREQ